MVYNIPIQYPFTSGLCYYVSGHLQDVGGGDSVLFEIGDGVTFDTLGTRNTNGGFSYMFTYDATPEYDTLRITITGDVTLTKLAIRLQEQCAVKVCSECYQINDCEPPHREHLKLVWTNNEDGLGFSYSIPFEQTLYIVGGLRNADYAYDEEIFTTSDRRRSPIYTAADKLKELWIHDLPEYIHDAIRVGLVHDYFYIDDVRYVKEEGSYTPDWDTPNSMLAPTIVKVREYSQETVNDNCI